MTQTDPNRPKPTQNINIMTYTEPNRAKPSQTEPNRAKLLVDDPHRTQTSFRQFLFWGEIIQDFEIREVELHIQLELWD